MELSKKQENRLRTTLRQSKVDVFDAPEGKKRPVDHICSVSDKLSQCSKETMSLISVFLRGENHQNLFSSIDSEGMGNVIEFSDSLEKNKLSMSRLAICTFFGASERMPLRGLSYLIPSLKMAEEIMNLSDDNCPTINYSFTGAAGSIINKYDINKINTANNQFIEIAKQYVETFHPRVVDNVVFSSDSVFAPEVINSSRFASAQATMEKMMENEQELKDTLERYGSRRSAAQNAMAYTTLHVFSQDLLSNNDNHAKMVNYFTEEPISQSDLTLYIGAKPEENFFAARKLCASRIAEDLGDVSLMKNAQYIANINTPPYSPLKEGELFLDEVIKDPSFIDEARPRDFHENEPLGKYQIPVQKAVSLIESDISAVSHENFNNLKQFIKSC